MKTRVIKLVHGNSILYVELFGLDRFGHRTESPRGMKSYGVSLPLRLPRSFDDKQDALRYIGRYVAEKILFDGYTATKDN